MCPLWEGREGTKGSKHCMSIARHAGGCGNANVRGGEGVRGVLRKKDIRKKKAEGD